VGLYEYPRKVFVTHNKLDVAFSLNLRSSLASEVVRSPVASTRWRESAAESP